jgi:hypothetical protein
MKRGNNYTGARWTHSQGNRPKPATVPPKPAPVGLTLMGGSNRKRTVWRDGKPA